MMTEKKFKSKMAEGKKKKNQPDILTEFKSFDLTNHVLGS